MKFLNVKFRHYWRRARDFCVYKILHADDPPHRLALGIAIGMFVTFTPLIGFQMILSFFLAWLLRANKVVGIPLVWISNPLTIVPIYFPCYWLGCQLLNMPVGSQEWGQLQLDWRQLIADPATTGADRIRFWWDSLVDFMGPLWLGCILVALTFGVISYYLSLLTIRNYRLRRWGQLMPPSLTPVESLEIGLSESETRGGSSGENAA